MMPTIKFSDFGMSSTQLEAKMSHYGGSSGRLVADYRVGDLQVRLRRGTNRLSELKMKL